jgi:hypothetical protein
MDFDKLLYIIAIVVFSVFSGWMKKRAQNQEEPSSADDPGPSPHPSPSAPPVSRPRPPRSAKSFDWEAELRRLLEGESVEPTPPPLRKPTEPPVIVARPVPTAKTYSPPASSSRPATPRPTPMVKVPAAAPYQPQPLPASAAPAPLARLLHSAEAIQRASHLQESIGERLHHVAELTKVGRADTMTRMASNDTKAARLLLRQRHTLRQAMVVSVALGPPKALES